MYRTRREEIEKLEIQLLLEAIFQFSGYDFRNYSYPSMKRRILYCVQKLKLGSISELQGKVLYDPFLLEFLLDNLSITVTEMFRDPEFFLAIRKEIVPQLRELPLIRIWDAGCSSGEEVYSLAMLLNEEGLYHKTRIYATDMNEKILEEAKLGQYELKKMRRYTKNYLKAGGTGEFSEYYYVNDGKAHIQPFLKENIIFAQHNLATDQSFNEFHFILCRNVLIYFNQMLKDQVFQLFLDSLDVGGFLGLGSKESKLCFAAKDDFKTINQQCNLFQKINF